jgi:UDP-glucose 4-epimerase
MQGVVSRAAHLCLDEEQIEVWGDGSVVRDYVYVWDAAEALSAIAHTERTADGTLPIFNIGGGVGSSVNDVMAALRRQSGEPLHLVYRDKRNFDVRVNVLDLTRAREDLHWEPRTSLEEGVGLLIADLRHDRDAPLASRPSPRVE